MKSLSFVTTLFALAASNVAMAQETIELGVLKKEDMAVVQKLMYPKQGRSEIGIHLGVMALDPYITTPNIQVSYTVHPTDNLGFGVVAGGGYGLKNNVYRTLESPAYGVAPYAYRYLGSVLGELQWAPIYAKLNFNGSKVVHFDIYGTAKAGISLEQSVIPDGGIAVAPTLSPGIGTRFFIGENTALRVEFRDDILLEPKQITSGMRLKQNANILVGLSMFTGKKGGR